MADPRVIQNIQRAAAQTGADPAALLAMSLTETGARTGPGVVGDKGTSYDWAQFHRGGALGNHTPAWAGSYASYVNRAQEFARLQVHGGKGAAAVQRPADPAGYALKVQGNLAEARRLLRSAAPTAHQAVTQPQITAPTIRTADHANIGTSMLQSLIDSSAANAGISTIQLPVATPIAPRKTPAPVHVAPDAVGTGPVDAKGASIVEVARRYLGTAYKWGGASPKTGFDCSGLLQWAAAQSGIKIPRTTYEQIKAGKVVSPNQLQPGDAVFFGSPGAPHHVGIALGNGKFLESPHTGAVVRISSLAGRSDFAGARRYA